MRLFARPMQTPLQALVGIATALLALPLAASAQDFYIALGDSYAFGYTTAGAAPSEGNQGYASIVRDVLDSRNGADAVTLYNLAIPGETSTSYFSGPSVLVPDGNPNDGADTAIRDGIFRNPTFNTNYSAPYTSPSELQTNKLATTISGIQFASGQNRVSFVSLQMGGNDILNLLIQPGFNALTPTQQGGLLVSRFNALSANLTGALGQINGLAPNAEVALIGYADPFAAFGPNNPLGFVSVNPLGSAGRVNVSGPVALTTLLTQEANIRIAEAAAQNDARYVDIYTPFLGNEAAYTQIFTIDPPGSGIPNFHPNAQGYAVIANSVAAPEPTAATLLLLPLAAVVARRRKRA